MGLLFDIPFFCEALCGILLLFLMFYHSVTKHFKYWEDRGVPHIKPSFPFGNTKELILGRKYVGEMYEYFNKQFKDEPFIGVYDMSKPVFVVRDPELIKHILTKDFNYFQDRVNLDSLINLKDEFISRHLFFLRGKEWKNMRVKLTPTFSSGKLKMMFQLMEKCGKQLANHLKDHTERDTVVDVKDVLTRYNLDIFATCAFGLDINCLENRNCEFYHYACQHLQYTFFKQIKRIFCFLFPNVKRITGVRYLSKDLTDFFTNIIRGTVEYREKYNVSRNDFLSLLIQVRQNKNFDEEHFNGNLHLDQNKPKDTTGLTIEEMTAQAFIFILAGFETASSTMSFCLYELAQHQDIQEKLYQEIKEVLAKHGGKLTYQALKEMPYMDKVINETLRHYASVPVLNRICTESYKVPDYDLVLEKGVSVVIPTFALNHDARFWDEPLKFDPERFSPERMRERHPYVFLPFGEGPRNCIGMRFGLFQTKMGLTRMLLNFEFGLTPQTQIPINLNKSAIVTQPEKPILLQLSRRTSTYIEEL